MAAEPHLVLGLFDIGSGAHWLIILFIGLLLFGRRLPELMKSLGGSIREFKKGMDEGPPQPPAAPPSSTQPPPPHIDGAVSRPAEAVEPPAQPSTGEAGAGGTGTTDGHGHPTDEHAHHDSPPSDQHPHH